MRIAPTLLRLACETLETADVGSNRTARAAAGRIRLAKAHAYARAIDWTAFEWFWLEGGLALDRRDQTIEEHFDGERAGPHISTAVKRAVLWRDGWHCRYCHLEVISPATMDALEKNLPAALPTSSTNFGTHRAWVLRLSWDHLVPRSRGGSNGDDNIVASCGACNYNKWSSTVEELGLLDPKEREVVTSEWDGLDGRLGTKRLRIDPAK